MSFDQELADTYVTQMIQRCIRIYRMYEEDWYASPELSPDLKYYMSRTIDLAQSVVHSIEPMNHSQNLLALKNAHFAAEHVFLTEGRLEDTLSESILETTRLLLGGTTHE